MKLRYIIIILTILLFALRIDYAHSEDLKKQQPALMISDSTTGFSVLKNLFDSGFFKSYNLFTQYIPVSEINDRKISGSRDLKLTSELKNISGAGYASFNLFLSDSIKQNIMILWEVQAGNKQCRNSSIRTMVDFAKNANDSTVSEALIQTPGFSGAIGSMNVRYRDNDQTTEINRYDLTMHTGFSQTHRFIRTFAELSFFTSIVLANYLVNRDANMEDWRYKYRWKDVWPRIRDGWSYDTNAFRTNTLYHFYSGAVYYQTARSNEYGILASTAWAFAGSFIWEYGGEWREKTSANDMIHSTFGGALLGEALRQSSIYVERCLDYSVYGSIIACILDPMRIFNRALDRAFSSSYKISIVFVNPAAEVIIEKSR